MVIRNARAALSATGSVHRDFYIFGGRIWFRNHARSGIQLDLSGYLLLPGLINSHDHLEFNLFPRLATKTYSNATEWATDIYRVHESPVREHLSVPKKIRLLWGGLKNLLSGVTTVAHHNPYDAHVFDNGFPVRVIRRFGWAHSLAFSPGAAAQYRGTPPNLPFVIHAGEGTDDCARAEIETIEKQGMLADNTVVVHGIAFDRAGFERIRKHGASLIWCPSSNLLGYGETLRRDLVHPTTPVSLGTDSAISAAGDLTDEIRVAHRDCGAAPELLFDMLTTLPARILRLNSSMGAIRHGAPADLLAVRDIAQNPGEALLDLTPELVIVGGSINLISKRLARNISAELTNGFHPIALEGRGEWLTPFDVPGTFEATRAALGSEIRLAGKRVLG